MSVYISADSINLVDYENFQKLKETFYFQLSEIDKDKILRNKTGYK